MDTQTQALRLDHANPDHGDCVVVDWTLGTTCNFACSYCPAALHDGRLQWQSATRVLMLYDDIHAHYVARLGREVWVQFTGGEPTLHPRIHQLLTEAAARGFRASMISNGSRTLRFWEKVAPDLDRVIFTYHDEFVDHDHFVAAARLLSESMHVHVNVTVHPDRFDAVLDKADDIAAAVPGATMTVKPLRLGFGETLYDYTPAQLARLGSRDAQVMDPEAMGPRGKMRLTTSEGAALRDASSFLTTDENRWLGWSCHAGIESLRISGDGQVYRAVCSTGGPLGNLNETVVLPMTAVRCDKQRCACIGDILISKARG